MPVNLQMLLVKLSAVVIELGHFYAIFCIRAISKAQHNNLLNLITLMNKVRIDILRRHSFSQEINSEIKIAFSKKKQRNKIIFGMN